MKFIRVGYSNKTNRGNRQARTEKQIYAARKRMILNNPMKLAVNREKQRRRRILMSFKQHPLFKQQQV